MPINFSIIQIIVYAGFLLTAANIYFNKKLGLNTHFSKIVQLINFYLAIHFVYIWMVEAVFTNGKYLDAIAPFSLLYGVFLYLSNYLTRNEKISAKQVIPHLVIPAFFWLWFAFLVFKGANYTDMTLVRVRLPISIITLLGYIFATIFFNKKPILAQYRFVRPIIIIGSISLLILVIIAIRIAFLKTITSNVYGVTSIRSVIYMCMLGCAIMIFKMQLSLQNFKPKDLRKNLK